MADWIRELDWRPGGPGLNPTVATSLRNVSNSVYPALAVSSGGDTKGCRYRSAGVYARGSKISHIWSK